MKVFQYPEIIEEQFYELVWEFEDCPGAGYSFPCTEEGEVINEHQLAPEAILNLTKCREGVGLNGPYIQPRWTRYRQEMVIACDQCGHKVHLFGDTACSNCGQWYNSSGQALNPPHLWEEDAWHIEEEDD